MQSPDPFALDELTAAQKQSLESFCQVTKEEDVQLAVRVLKSRQWRVEQAVEMYYEPGYVSSLTATAVEEPAGSSQLRQRTTAQSRSGSSRADSQLLPETEQGPKQVSRQKPQFSLMPLLTWPILLVVHLATTIINVVLQLAGRPRITFRTARTNRAAPYSSDRSQFVREFESAYGTVHVPFYTGSFAEAQAVARQETKYLVVMLWSSEHDDTPLFEHVLTQPALVQCLSRSQFVVWAGDVANSDAFKTAESLGVCAFPFIGILFMQQTGRSGMQLLARMDGLGSSANAQHLANMLVRFVDRPVSRHEQTLYAARREQQERESARRLLEQQNAAYERSLALDQERERARREQEERERKEKEEAEALLREEQRREELCRQWRWAKFAEQQQQQQQDDKDLVTTLSLRLENGSRVVCKFAASATLQHVFDFVETREVAEEWAQAQTTPYGTDLSKISMPKGYEHTYEFAVVSQFPRVVFEDRSANLKDALSANGLWPSAALIVEPLFEPED
ncbi:Ubx domain-containing protein [Coemansia sp. RSA 2336]|nr:Ubx domain-containing protein [Coemansia sp. RSA 2336]